MLVPNHVQVPFGPPRVNSQVVVLTLCYSGQYPQRSAPRGTQDLAPRALNSACTYSPFSAAIQKVRLAVPELC